MTGASGFIGKALEMRLRAEGYSVRRVVRLDRGHVDEIKCDLSDSVDVWGNALGGVDAVFHLAWSTVPKTANSAPLTDLSTNLVGTVSLLEAMRRRPRMPMIFASSGGTVYGTPESTPIKESHPLRPLGVYGAAKVSAESYAMAYRRQFGVDARILRLSNPFGPGQNVEGQLGAASVFAWRALLGEPIEIWGDGSIVRDYLFIDDTVNAFIAMMKAPDSVFSATEPVINIGSGNGVSLVDIVHVIEKILQKSIRVRYQPSRTFDIPINVLDVSLARRVLEWFPVTAFEDGIRLTLDSFKRQIG